MDPETYKILYEVEENHWWFKGRRKIILSQIHDLFKDTVGVNILDVGCGTGITMEYLEEYGKVFGLDNSKKALKFCKIRGLKNLFQADACFLPFKDQSYHLVTVLDLLEHLEDDMKGLKEFHRVLQPGGKIIIFVPAFRFLWSFQDDISHHKRRYTLNHIKRNLLKTNFKLSKISYANCFLFPVIFFLRSIMKLLRIKLDSENKINVRILNKGLSKIFSSEAQILKKMNLPFGVSILCVAEKL